jgi:hypothetical protein
MSNILEIWWMHQKRKKSNKKYSKLIAQANGDEREFLIQEAMNVRDEERDQILSRNSDYLIEEAEYLSLPVPILGDTESWERSRRPTRNRLTLRAQSELRRAIRKEKQDKWSVSAFRLKELALPLIGILGALSGVISVFHALWSK